MAHSQGPSESGDLSPHIHHVVPDEHAVQREAIIESDLEAGLGIMVLGLVLVVLLIGAVLWVAFAGVGGSNRRVVEIATSDGTVVTTVQPTR